MEQMALSCISSGDVGAKNASMSLASPLYLGRSPSKAAQVRCLQSRRVLGFKGVRVYFQSGLGGGVGMPRCKRVGRSCDSLAKNRVVVAASSQEGSASSDVEVEKVRNELDKQAKESEEAWKQTLDAVKEQASRMQEQASKMQGISKEAYAVYAEKAKIVLKDTTEQLKLQSEKMRVVLASSAEDISVKGKENLSIWMENAPETVKDVAETALGVHPEDLKNLSKIHDFCLGIPYGALLFLGGFLSFLVTGSIPAVRFGVILGGIHLAISISSLKAWKKGDSSIPFVKGQAAIAFIILARELRVLCQRPSLIPGFSMAVLRWKNMLASATGAVEVVTFDYPYCSGGKRGAPPKAEKLVDAHVDEVKKAVTNYPGHPLVLVGKSMGSRVSCMVAEREDIDASAVICLGYPLKGVNGAIRDETLLQLSVPVMFVQGSKDGLCPLQKLEAVRKKMTVANELYVIDGGDHSLKIGKRHLKTKGENQVEVEMQALMSIQSFLSNILKGP